MEMSERAAGASDPLTVDCGPEEPLTGRAALCDTYNSRLSRKLGAVRTGLGAATVILTLIVIILLGQVEGTLIYQAVLVPLVCGIVFIKSGSLGIKSAASQQRYWITWHYWSCLISGCVCATGLAVVSILNGAFVNDPAFYYMDVPLPTPSPNNNKTAETHTQAYHDGTGTHVTHTQEYRYSHIPLVVIFSVLVGVAVAGLVCELWSLVLCNQALRKPHRPHSNKPDMTKDEEEDAREGAGILQNIMMKA